MTATDLVADWRNAMVDVTPGPWAVYDGCSWRRIGTAHGRRDDCAVLAPTKASDGHPDLTCSRGNDRDANLNWIARCSPNAIAGLLDALLSLQSDNDALRARLEEAEADIGWVQTAHLICERLGIEPKAEALHICGGIARLRSELERVKGERDELRIPVTQTIDEQLNAAASRIAVSEWFKDGNGDRSPHEVERFAQRIKTELLCSACDLAEPYRYRAEAAEARIAGLETALRAAASGFRTYAKSAEGHFATKYELAKDLRIQADLIDAALQPISPEGR